MTAKEHNKLLSIFFFIQGGIQLLAGIFIVLVYGILGGSMMSVGSTDQDQFVGGVFLVMAVVVGAIMLLISGFYLFSALKMLREQKIGRTLGVIGSIFSLMSFPLGTALGVYGLWFLFGDVGRGFYEGIEHAGMNYTPPPPPNSWQ